MNPRLYQKIFFTLVFIALLAMAFLIIRPFLTAVLTAIVFSYIFYPLYQKLRKKFSNRNFASLIASLIVVLIITMPLFFVLNTLSSEAYASYLISRQKLSTIHLIGADCVPQDKTTCKLVNLFQETADNPRVRYYLDTSIKSATTRITESISGLLLSIPVFLLHFFITLFVMFFLFRDGKILLNKIEKLMPLKDKHRRKIFNKLDNMTYAVIYGAIIIAVIQGALGGLGFFVFGVPAPFLWGIIMMFAALIPFIGSSIVWFPASLFLLLNGYLDSDTTLILRGVFLMAYGFLVVSAIDNILRPKIVGDKGGLHPVLVLLGVVGGLQLFGFIGILVGPILLAVFVTFIQIYEEEKPSGL